MHTFSTRWLLASAIHGNQCGHLLQGANFALCTEQPIVAPDVGQLSLVLPRFRALTSLTLDNRDASNPGELLPLLEALEVRLLQRTPRRALHRGRRPAHWRLAAQTASPQVTDPKIHCVSSSPKRSAQQSYVHSPTLRARLG